MAIERGDGWAAGHLDDMGEGPGFRKIRRELDVEAFGINAVVLPPGHAGPRHRHERQEELYFVHAGTIELEFEGGVRKRLGPGGVARVDASTARRVINVGDGEAVFVSVGGAGGYVGRDGVRVDD